MNVISGDVVQYASQIGRLDFLSATLAVLALILGLGAFPLFYYLQRRAEQVAREEVDKVLEGAVDKVEELAISKLESLLPTLIDDYMELVRNSVSPDQADKIAEAAAKEENGGDDD